LLRRRVALRGTGLIEATTGLVVAFVVGFLFALPSPYSGTSMPSKLLWNVLPAFRVRSRREPLLMAALLPLAALGLQRVWAAARQRGAGAAVAVVAVAIVISFVELTDHTVPRFRTVPVPPEYTALKAETPNGVLAEYPLGYSDIYRLWQRVHGRPLVNGAPEGTTADQVHLGLLDPAEPGTASALSLLGVTAIMLHPGGPADVPVQPREPTAADGYRLVGRFPDQASVWNVVAPPAPALATLWGGFAPPRREGNGPMLAALVGETGTIELRAKKAGLVRLVFDAALESGNGSLHVGDGRPDVAVPLAGATTPVSVIVQVPSGQWQVLVKTDGDS